MKKLLSANKQRSGIIILSILFIASFLFCFQLRCLLPAKAQPANQPSMDEMATNSILSASNLYASPVNTVFDSSPYFINSDVILHWRGDASADGFTIEIARDPEFNQLIAHVIGEGSGPCRLPNTVLHDNGRYYYRVIQTASDGHISEPSSTEWFAVDPHFTGIRVLVTGDHPLGKSESSVTVRDADGELHMAISRHIDVDAKEICWMSSTDNGATWIKRGRVNLPEHTFAKAATIIIDSKTNTLYVSYMGANSMRVPQPVVICKCDLNEPVPSFKDHVILTDSETYSRSFLGIDDLGVVHATWTGPGVIGQIYPPAIFYSNNETGLWKPVKRLCENQTVGFSGSSHLACINSTVHVFWEGGAWRYSDDYGETWAPPLSEGPAFAAPDLNQSHGIRWRVGTSTVIPGEDEIALALIGERRDNAVSDNWTKYLNFDEIWVVRYSEDTGWTFPEEAYSYQDEISETDSVQMTEQVRFLERPDLSADGSGRLYLAWDETTGYGSDQRAYERRPYVSWTNEDGQFSTPVQLPGVNDLCGMKPLLGEARMMPGFDLIWFAGEIPSPNLRPLRSDMELALLGMMFATENTLTSQEQASTEYLGSFSAGESGSEANTREAFPGIYFPEVSRSASPVTGTYTPTAYPTLPPTPTSPPTSTPQVTYIESSASADTYVDSIEPYQNYGNEMRLWVTSLESVDQLSFALMHFDLSFIPPGSEIAAAELHAPIYQVSNDNINLEFFLTEEWDEMTVTWYTQPGVTAKIWECDVKSPIVIPMKNIVREWVDHPSENHGIEIRIESNGVWGYGAFYAWEWVNHPILKVWYTSSGQPTPTPYPPTPTPDISGLDVDLELNKTNFTPGDQFLLELTAVNNYTSLVRLNTFVVLDIMSEFWFWPDWSQTPNFEIWDLSEESSRKETILDFDWPGNAGSFEGARFWGILTDPNSNELVYDEVTFSWSD